jgi:hypothetical protein
MHRALHSESSHGWEGTADPSSREGEHPRNPSATSTTTTLMTTFPSLPERDPLRARAIERLDPMKDPCREAGAVER